MNLGKSVLKRILAGINVRLAAQTVFLLCVVAAGTDFYFYCQNLLNGEAGSGITKPAAVEGFLPIGALVGLKNLIFTGNYDVVHPAGLTIFLAAVIVSAVFKKGFCSHVCPVGFVSELASRAGFRLRVPRYAALALSSVKYILLFFFVYAIFFAMSPGDTAAFIDSPYNRVADAKMLYFFLNPSAVSIIVLAVLLALALVFGNFWCRFLCPYGALLGMASLLSPFRATRNGAVCFSCGKCSEACPGALRPSEKTVVSGAACFGCADCLRSCGKAGAIRMSGPRSLSENPEIYSALCVATFLSLIAVGYAAGFWTTSVRDAEYAELLKYLNFITHP